MLQKKHKNKCKRNLLKRLFLCLLIGLFVFYAFNYFKAKRFNEKIASMVMVSFKGASISKDDTIYNSLKNKKLGGVILHDKNYENIKNKEQVKRLCKQIKNANKNALIAIDEEGGRVSRLNHRRGFFRTYTAKHIAKFHNFNKTRAWSRKIANKLKSVNINYNLAPVVDLEIAKGSLALSKKKRMFSDDVNEVVKQASIFIKEHQRKNILTSLKHFPGYGSAFVDPHVDITDVTNSWHKRELKPYKILIENGLADTIMTAHIFQRKLDSKYPSTLSKKIIDGILRKKLKFNGVVISDDLLMGAIIKKYSFQSAVILAINAGVDILLFSKEYYEDKEILDEVIRIVNDGIKNGIIKKERIEESYKRIRSL